jgi:hypothetical protein
VVSQRKSGPECVVDGGSSLALVNGDGSWCCSVSTKKKKRKAAAGGRRKVGDGFQPFIAELGGWHASTAGRRRRRAGALL